MSDAFGPLEEAFFAAGDALEAPVEDSSIEQDFYLEIDRERPRRLTLLRLWLGTALTAATTRVILQARLLQLRVAVALSTCAEHALQATAFGVADARPIGTRVHSFIPRLTRNPVLVRVSVLVLVFTAATFPAAAVLAATGAI